MFLKILQLTVYLQKDLSGYKTLKTNFITTQEDFQSQNLFDKVFLFICLILFSLEWFSYIGSFIL